MRNFRSRYHPSQGQTTGGGGNNFENPKNLRENIVLKKQQEIWFRKQYRHSPMVLASGEGGRGRGSSTPTLPQGVGAVTENDGLKIWMNEILIFRLKFPVLAGKQN